MREGRNHPSGSEYICMDSWTQDPILKQAFDADWYFPFQPPDDVLSLPEYQRAVAEGWDGWIETELDVEAIKQGYIYDLSRDSQGRPAWWFDGAWQLQDGRRVEVEDEASWISHVGKGDRFLRFAEVFLKHTKGDIANQPYRFIHWMRKACATLFGWVQRDGAQYRRYQHAYFTMAKKNAKSAIMSVISLYMLVADGTQKAYVYGAACDRAMGRIIFDEAAHMVRSSEALESEVSIIDSRSRITHPDSGSFYTVLSADAHRNDGIDSSCTLVDEIHRHPNRKLYVVLKRAGLARPNPLMGIVTTYGPSLGDGSIWAEVHNEAKAVLTGGRPKAIQNFVMVASAEPIPVTLVRPASAGDTRLYVSRIQQPILPSTIEFDVSAFLGDDASNENKIPVTIAAPVKRFSSFIDVEPLTEDIPAFSEATANEDWRSDHAIERSNPSVGITISLDRVRQEIEAARTPEAEAETRQLNLNIVSGSGRKWLSAAAWQAAGKMLVQPKKLLGRYCYGGADISFGNDLTAFALAFPSWDVGTRIDEVDKPRIDILAWCWVPEKGLEEREELEQFPFRHHAKQTYLFDGRGPVRICEGSSVINYGQVAQDIGEICRCFSVRGIGYDPYMAQFIVPQLEKEGLTCIAHRQGALSMGPPVKRFSECILRGHIAHGNNPVLDKAVEGAVLHPKDRAGNTYLSKGDSHSRIDVLVASVMATGFAASPPNLDGGAYASAESGMWG